MKKLIVFILIAGAVFWIYRNNQTASGGAEDGVILFTADDCPPCDEAAAFLEANGIDHVVCNILDSDENMALFREFDGRAFPLIVFGDERIEGFDRSQLSVLVEGGGSDAGSTDVVIYMTPRCGWCERASRYFEEQGIEFVEYDIDASDHYRQEFIELGGTGTPLIFIGDKRISGFNQKAIDLALRRAGLI